MLSSDNKETFLSIVRLGIGHHAGVQTQNVDWNAIETLAAEQGLSAVIVDGVDRLPLELRPPKPILLQWIGETLQGYEYRYELYCRTIAEMAAFYNEHGFKMMVLKGYACSLDWPKPEHRPTGDIDIWLFGKQKETDALLSKEKGIKIDKDRHHHTVFYWRDFMVENHYDFINTHRHISHQGLEDILKELGQDDTHFVELYGEKVYLPSANLHALFLIRHALNHFASIGISVRQVLDWAFFVEKHTKEVDWNWLLKVLEEYHMKEFFNIINAICVEDLGFPVSIFPSVQFEPRLKDKVWNDIIAPEYSLEEPRGLIRKYLYRYKRWQGNAWKQDLCYKESRTGAFWLGVKAKLVKPTLK